MFPLATLVGMFCVCVSDKREIIERDLEYVKFICPAGCSHILKIRSHVTGKWVRPHAVAQSERMPRCHPLRRKAQPAHRVRLCLSGSSRLINTTRSSRGGRVAPLEKRSMASFSSKKAPTGVSWCSPSLLWPVVAIESVVRPAIRNP
ncbi:uncharacterized protein LOC111259606 [Varroa jacobsoni]|uniref:uncharacterized protein LOC111259606 n=1 Tax=Varroa jacobsoni TaxID=62625 RepID=UPI000BF3400E|nr:uncharacterized protein LOC111259606 [Varroa jacobsoni]